MTNTRSNEPRRPVQRRPRRAEYDLRHARSGLSQPLPRLTVLPNQFTDYLITITIPEYSSVCPRSGLPDTGTITIEYEPGAWIAELKALKYYVLGYRNLGIFYENAVNRIAHDFIRAVKPRRAIIRGDFRPRGGINTSVIVRHRCRGNTLH